MKWFRSNIKHGARLALLALALQFGLSFGHFHAGAAQAAALAIQSVAAQSDIIAASPRPTPSIRLLRCRRPTTIPTITRASIAPSAPSSRTPVRCCLRRRRICCCRKPIALLYLTTDAEFVHLNPVGVAFQPRAPPAS